MHLHLLFVLPLVTGFASLPGEECFFLYSAEPSLAYLLVPGNIPPNWVVPPTDPEDVGKVGKVWEGVKLEIKGPETVEPETVTAQDAIARFPASLATMSETFCLPYGTYSIETTTPTATTAEQRLLNDTRLGALLGIPAPHVWSPQWLLFPADLRDNGVATLDAMLVGFGTIQTMPADVDANYAISVGLGWAASNADSVVVDSCLCGQTRPLTIPTSRRRRLTADEECA